MNKNRVPKASPEPLPELAAFLEPFAPLFRQHTSHESMERYLTGLLTDLPHKICETIADVTAGITNEELNPGTHRIHMLQVFHRPEELRICFVFIVTSFCVTFT